MKNRYYRNIALGVVASAALLSSSQANAQFYDIVSQIPNLVSPALSGSMSYKGMVDVTATFGLGHDRANFVGVSTSQGFQYSSWFFMGAGIGIDLAMSSTTDYPLTGPEGPIDPQAFYYPGAPKISRTKAMIPVFTDFRFNFGANGGTSLFIDIKAGAAWLLGSSYLELNSGALSNKAQFMLRPSLGVRIPTSKDNPRSAMNVGVTYQLLTADNGWSYWNTSYNPTLSSLGVSIGFEW